MRRDFDAYRNTGDKGSKLLKIEEALLKIPPTSVEAERASAFSSAASLCTEINKI